MNYKELPSDILIEQLLHGWQPAHSSAAQELVRRLGGCLEASTEIKEVGKNDLSFVIELEDIYLRDMNHVPCFMLSGGATDSQTVRALCQKLAHHLTFVLALSDSALDQVRQEFPQWPFLLLSVEQIKHLLKGDDPKQFIREMLWQQIPKRRLIPYNFMIPAIGNMFFGRHEELARLRDEHNTSFAIVGPGRIGKTSLLSRYRDELRRMKDPMRFLTLYITCYDCMDHSPDGVARFFAMKIDSTSRHNRMTADQLANFMRYQANRLGGPLNLLFDEVDEICQGEAFSAIAWAARAGYCRLILSGRGELLKMMLNSKSPLQSRLDMLQLEPLDERSARELLLRPLTDLGFKLESEGMICDQVLRLTGHLPNLLNIYGHRLANLAIEQETHTISLNFVETVKWDHLVAQYFISPLLHLQDVEARLVGFSLLKSTGQAFSIAAVQKIAAQAGLDLDYARAYEICNDLVICNVLVWHNGMFRIANEGLYFYAKEMGFLERGLN